MTDSDKIAVIVYDSQMPESCRRWLATHKEWAPLPGAKFYEASHRKSVVRSIDRTVNGRRLRSVELKSRPNDDGYLLVNVTDDDGNRVTRAVASCVMLAHAGPCPPGLEIRHLNNTPPDCRYCGCGGPGCTEGNMVYGTRQEQYADQLAAGTAVFPESFECVNYPRCDGRAKNPGRRCRACVVQVGEITVQMLNAGMPLTEIAERFGFTSNRWIYDLAVQHGYKGTKAQAQAQRPTLAQRVTLLGIVRLARRSGQLAR